MAITGPVPPFGAPPSPVDLSGLAAMFGSVNRDMAGEAMVEKLRPALRLIGDLERLLEQTPEIAQTVQAIIDARLGKGRGKARKEQPGPPQPLQPGGPPGVGVPGGMPQIPGMGMMPMPRGGMGF